MAHRVFLYQNYILSGPKWWNNFYNESLKSDSTLEEINQLLEPYAAEFICGVDDTFLYVGPREIQFETKEDFTAFVLKWS